MPAAVGVLGVATASEELFGFFLLGEAAFVLLLFLGVSEAFPIFAGASGCFQASPLTSTGPRDGSLPSPVLPEADVAFVRPMVPREVLGIAARASPCSKVCPQAPVATPPCAGAFWQL